MKILALESSSKAASAALLDDGNIIARTFQSTGLTHSRTLLPMTESMLRNCEVPLSAVDVFAVAAGPGSFTGLRIGISAVKGLAWAEQKPCCPVSTLEGMAWNVAHMNMKIICAMDARRNQIYSAVFDSADGRPVRLTPDRAIAAAALAEELEGDGSPKVIIGCGAQICFDALAAKGIPCSLAPRQLRLQDAAGVALAAYELTRAGKTVSADALLPVYLRPSQAERMRSLNKVNNDKEQTP